MLVATPNLLVVEDDPLTREFLSEALSAGGWRIEAVGRIDAAVKALEDSSFDLVLSDVQLPDGDAFSLVRAIRRQDTGGACTLPPAIALTAQLDRALRARLLEAGYLRVLEKPVALSVLLDAVTAVLGGAGDNESAPRCSVTKRGVESPLAPEPDPMSLPHFDDALAERICGNAQIAVAMRELLRFELPGMLTQLEDSARSNDHQRAREILHRLRSAAGFCGASRLTASIAHAAVDDADVATVASQIATILHECTALLGLLEGAGPQQQA